MNNCFELMPSQAYLIMYQGKPEQAIFESLVFDQGTLRFRFVLFETGEKVELSVGCLHDIRVEEQQLKILENKDQYRRDIFVSKRPETGTTVRLIRTPEHYSLHVATPERFVGVEYEHEEMIGISRAVLSAEGLSSR